MSPRSNIIAFSDLTSYHSSDSLSSMSIASSRYNPTSPSPTPELEYMPDSPIKFGTTEHVEPIVLRPLRMDDDQVSDKYLAPPPPPTTMLSSQLPPQIRIKVEDFEDAHNAIEVQDKQDAADSSDSDSDEDAEAHIPASVPSDVRRSLQDLYKILRTKFDPQPLNALDVFDNDTNSSRSSGWDSDHDEEYATLWPTPPATPIEGDDMHVPQPQVCGQHPGDGWENNSIGTQHYYRFLIPDPATGRNVVAPFVSYAINRSRPTISGTYGQGYPIRTRPLTASRVDYPCPPITQEQRTLFETDASFAPAIDHVLGKFAPYDLTAAIRQYQFYRDTISESVKSLHYIILSFKVHIFHQANLFTR